MIYFIYYILEIFHRKPKPLGALHCTPGKHFSNHKLISLYLGSFILYYLAQNDCNNYGARQEPNLKRGEVQLRGDVT